MADETKQDTWLGINTIQVEDPSKNNALFGIPTAVSDQNSDPNKNYQSHSEPIVLSCIQTHRLLWQNDY